MYSNRTQQFRTAHKRTNIYEKNPLHHVTECYQIIWFLFCVSVYIGDKHIGI